ncbi:MAG: hypothetical protein KC646_12165 [Candidatus Cloacimonetes bacterium]|nr:hypothetical protein [Candidatus Cloacimonadota bacterium]
MKTYKAFDVESIKQNFEFIESVLLDYGLANYQVVDSAELRSCSIRSGVILIKDNTTTFNDLNQHYEEGLSVCIAPTQIIVKQGSVSKDAIFHVEMDERYSQSYISKLGEFILFLVMLLAHEKEVVQQTYKKSSPSESQTTMNILKIDSNIVDNINYTNSFFESTFRDKGLDLEKVSDSIYSINEKVELVYSRHKISCRLKYDLNKFAHLGYHSDIRIDRKFQISIMVLPTYTPQRVDMACDLVVESVKHLLEMM